MYRWKLFQNYFDLSYPYKIVNKISNLSNILLYKLNKSINKKEMVNSILLLNKVNIVIVDPGDLVFYLNKKDQLKLMLNIRNRDKAISYYYKYFFRYVIKFSKNVIHKFEYFSVYHFINENKVRTIGVHIRLGKYGDFHEKNATYFATKQCLSNFNNSIRYIINKRHIEYIILSSDSIHLTKIKKNNVIIVRNLFKSKILKHSNNWYFNPLNNDSIECLLEMYMLSKSNYLLLTKNSSFSKVAFYMNKNCIKEECKYL